MRLAGIAIVRNECDIVEAFVRHNEAVLDRLYILDNDSSDGTLEILQRSRRDTALNQSSPRRRSSLLSGR